MAHWLWTPPSLAEIRNNATPFVLLMEWSATGTRRKGMRESLI